jgi:hypothetical protein
LANQSYTSNLLQPPSVMQEPLLLQPAGAQPPVEHDPHPIVLFVYC